MARPKVTFTDDMIEKIEYYAGLNCKSQTIASALDIPVSTLKRRFGRLMKKCRAQYKLKLMEKQNKLSENSADMAKFLGKNYLDQTDKQVLEQKEPKEHKALSEREIKAAEAAAKAYNESLSRTPKIVRIEKVG